MQLAIHAHIVERGADAGIRGEDQALVHFDAYAISHAVANMRGTMILGVRDRLGQAPTVKSGLWLRLALVAIMSLTGNALAARCSRSPGKRSSGAWP